MLVVDTNFLIDVIQDVVAGMSILTRDIKRYTSYFAGVTLITP